MRDEDRIPQDQGPLVDYVRQSYPPVGELRGLHSASVLRTFLRRQGWTARLWPVLERCRELVGPNNTVWGIKDVPGVELYFYDVATVEELADGLSDLVEVQARFRGDYLMCSLELDGQGRTDGFRVYRPGNPRDHSPDGTSYLLGPQGPVMENLYWFYPPVQLKRVMGHVDRSIHLGRKQLDRMAVDCHSLCFSNKRFTDALYYSRLDTLRTRSWLRARWPEMGDVLDDPELEHLRWDVGVDFQGQRPVKVGLYGFY